MRCNLLFGLIGHFGLLKTLIYLSFFLSFSLFICIYIYIHMYVCMYICLYSPPSVSLCFLLCPRIIHSSSRNPCLSDKRNPAALIRPFRLSLSSFAFFFFFFFFEQGKIVQGNEEQETRSCSGLLTASHFTRFSFTPSYLFFLVEEEKSQGVLSPIILLRTF